MAWTYKRFRNRADMIAAMGELKAQGYQFEASTYREQATIRSQVTAFKGQDCIALRWYAFADELVDHFRPHGAFIQAEEIIAAL